MAILSKRYTQILDLYDNGDLITTYTINVYASTVTLSNRPNPTTISLSTFVLNVDFIKTWINEWHSEISKRPEPKGEYKKEYEYKDNTLNLLFRINGQKVIEAKWDFVDDQIIFQPRGERILTVPNFLHFFNELTFMVNEIVAIKQYRQ